MRSVTSLFLYEEDIRFFGPGPYRLLKCIDETGSIRSAAGKMNLSYSKALYMLKRAEEVLGFSLMEKRIGGKGGGGSQLTAQTREFLKKYEVYQEKCCESNQKLFREIFTEF